jgi:tRNA(fMet)-specific endonuclease VapC
MMRYLLDANAIVDLLNNTDSKLAKRVRRESPNDIAISAIVSHELFYGAYKSGRQVQNLGRIDALQFAVLEFDKEDARQSGLVRASLASRGMPIGPYDVLIAGQALARNMTLITRNMHDFSRVPGLRMEDWSA